jgi:hypothetical protein
MMKDGPTPIRIVLVVGIARGTNLDHRTATAPIPARGLAVAWVLSSVSGVPSSSFLNNLAIANL